MNAGKAYSSLRVEQLHFRAAKHQPPEIPHLSRRVAKPQEPFFQLVPKRFGISRKAAVIGRQHKSALFRSRGQPVPKLRGEHQAALGVKTSEGLPTKQHCPSPCPLFKGKGRSHFLPLCRPFVPPCQEGHFYSKHVYIIGYTKYFTFLPPCASRFRDGTASHRKPGFRPVSPRFLRKKTVPGGFSFPAKEASFCRVP